ncbi:hypothetical protein L208DRAFT_1371777 [Tricholoma matsutake]|nr:hypothetical protein L208DRAFT_1371777 [Tricholoma matsutake 945]
MYCSKLSFKDGLQSIISAADSLKPTAYAALCRTGKQPQHSPACPTLPALFLPIPDSIVSTLIEHGCPPAAAHSLSDAYLRTANEFRAAYQAAHRQLVQQLASNTSDRSSRIKDAVPLLECQYRDKLLAAEKIAVDQVLRIQHAAPHMKSKPMFNQEFVPLLEKYFEYNTYPSTPDRVVLARKSMMTPRQIEVWFQNHRNRAKKDGRPLRRLNSDSLPLKLSLESVEKKMPFFIIPENERKDSTHLESADDAEEESFGPTQNDPPFTFNMGVPPHAFPTPYPLSCTYDLFPSKTRKHTFSAPVWARKPAISLPRRTAVDFEDFMSDFAEKLVLREPSSKKHTDEHRKNILATKDPWFAATQTTAPPAPHPALIQSSASIRVTRIADLLSTISAPSSHLRPFRSPSPTSQPITLVPNMPNDSRKVARLPKRLPRHCSMAHRSASLLSSEASPCSSSRTLSSSSRTPSFGSDTSSDRRPSSSSSHSSSSSTLTTPEFLPTPLPGNAVSLSVLTSGVGFVNEHGLFRFSLSDSFSQLQSHLHAVK